jgi:hypothetical protein
MILALITLALAAPKAPAVIIPPVTEIDFGELEVEGSRSGAAIKLVAERRQAQFPVLVKLRPNFNEKLEASTAEVR